MKCPPSAKLNAELPDVVTDFAKEGTCAHELAEFKLNEMFGINSIDREKILNFMMKR
jgi:hypothetical protein